MHHDVGALKSWTYGVPDKSKKRCFESMRNGYGDEAERKNYYVAAVNDTATHVKATSDYQINQCEDVKESEPRFRP